MNIDTEGPQFRAGKQSAARLDKDRQNYCLCVHYFYFSRAVHFEARDFGKVEKSL